MNAIERVIRKIFPTWADVRLNKILKSVEPKHKICLMNKDFPSFNTHAFMWMNMKTYEGLEIPKYEPVVEGYEKGGKLIPVIIDDSNPKRIRFFTIDFVEWQFNENINVRYMAVYNIEDGRIIYMFDSSNNEELNHYLVEFEEQLLLEIS